MKIIVVTGGVMSGIGKGITASSIGVILKKYGYGVTAIKIDPYLNQDAGTMSPYQHGEVFLLSDGGETDLDLGNYERFLHTTLSKDHNITSGKIYKSVLDKEREGKYLGKTVQIVPHITNEIRDQIYAVCNKMYASTLCAVDFCIIELGGTIGDMESLPYVEALRQMHHRSPEDMMFVHVSYLPILKSTKEIKTKPTQHSVKELRSLGIVPDMICLRCDRDLKSCTNDIVVKVAGSCGVAEDSVIVMPDQSSIYDVPLLFDKLNIVNNIRRKFEDYMTIMNKVNSLKGWESIAAYMKRCKAAIDPQLKVAVVGKYTSLEDSYLSLRHAIEHAGFHLNKTLQIDFIDASDYDKCKTYDYDYSSGKITISKFNIKSHKQTYSDFSQYNAVIIPGGFDKRGTEGMMNIIGFCRYFNIPILGICLGMQLMVVKLARIMLNNRDAASEELIDRNRNSYIKNFYIVKMATLNKDMGGTMRLGSKDTSIEPENKVYELYKKYDLIKKNEKGEEYITERYRHRYEVNPSKIVNFKKIFIGHISDRKCILELDDHPFFVGCQYHPEYQTYPFKPHPLFVGLLEAALEHKQEEVLENLEKLIETTK